MNQYNEISTLQYLGSKARIISHICDPIIKNPELHPGDEKPRLSLSFGILIPKSNQNRVF